MKLLISLLSVVLLYTPTSYETFRWGQIGHRTVGHIADGLLTKKARKKIQEVLGHETLAEVSTWMDDVRSDREIDKAKTARACCEPKRPDYPLHLNSVPSIVIAIQNLIFSRSQVMLKWSIRLLAMTMT